MKYLLPLIALGFLTFAPAAYADHDHTDHSQHEQMDTSDHADALPLNSGDAHISVNGLVCDFCARALEKTFGKREEVKGINVDLEKKIVTIHFNDGKTIDDATLTQIITDSGYNVEGIHYVE